MELVKPPEISRYREMILQSAIRRRLASPENLRNLLSVLRIEGIAAEHLEVLGEKALTQGHIDLLLKQRVPIGLSPKIPIEVKTKRASGKDAIQLRGYMDELKNECPAGLLVASDFAKQAVALAPASRIRLVRYNIALNLRMSPTFDDICDALSLEPM